MARPISSIERHPQCEKIITALASGTKLKDITAWTDPPVSIMALSRYRNYATTKTTKALSAVNAALSIQGNGFSQEAVQTVTKATLALAVDPFAQAALKSAARRERWMDDLEQSPDLDTYKVLATMDRNDLAAQEYAAKLAGRLDSRPVTNIAIVLPAQPGASAAAEDGEIIDITVR